MKNMFCDRVEDVVLVDELKKILTEICEAHLNRYEYTTNYKKIITQLTGFSYKRIKGCQNCCCLSSATIYYSAGGLMTILHEICHAIQHRYGFFGENNSLRKSLIMEQQCQAMTLFIKNKLFPKYKAPSYFFKHYFRVDSLVFLKNYYNLSDLVIDDLPNFTGNEEKLSLINIK